MNRLYRQLVAVVLVGSLAACGGVTSPSQNKTEPISGTITKGGGYVTMSYNVSKSGELTVKVTSLTPSVPANLNFLVAIYQGGCGGALVAYNPGAVVGAAVTGSIYVGGTYCVLIQDEGFFTADENVTATFSHP